MNPRLLARASLVLAAALSLPACIDGGPLAAHETLTETRPFEHGGSFELENVNGRVDVATWNEPEVRIVADKSASSRSLLRRLEVRIEGQGSRVSVFTQYPRRMAWFLGSGGQVNYRITLPADARVRVKTVNGRVEVDGVATEVRASTTNGSVEVKDAGGPVVVSTVNGSVTAGYRSRPPDAETRLSTTNGSLTLLLPEGTGGRLEAQTVNGSVENDFPLQSTDRSSRHRLTGRLGEGNGSIEMTTVNGSIHVARR
jgi:putative adhesin